MFLEFTSRGIIKNATILKINRYRWYKTMYKHFQRRQKMAYKCDIKLNAEHHKQNNEGYN